MSHISLKKELTKVLELCKMDQYVGMTSSQLASELIDYMGKRKQQKQIENSTRQSWYWNEGEK